MVLQIFASEYDKEKNILLYREFHYYCTHIFLLLIIWIMAKRQIYSLEFPIRCSPGILYNFLSNASGLQEWFADKVDERDGVMSFSWHGGTPDRATIVDRQENLLVRYSWQHESPNEYFEFKITTAEISNQTILVVTAFANKEDIKDESMVWEHQIKDLMHRIGS